MTALRVDVGEPTRSGDVVSWSALLRAPSRPDVSVSLSFTTPDDVPYAAHARPFLFAALLPAMRLGLPLAIDLPVDATTLENLTAWQETFASWRPHRLRVVPVLSVAGAAANGASRRCIVPPPDGRRDRALTAFSGGVDSCFTVVRHAARPSDAAAAATALTAGLMVQGFDIGLDRADEFESAWERSKDCLASFGLRAFRLRTDVRSLARTFDCDWEEEAHGIWLAAALACYEPWFARMLIPSTYAVPMLRLPWASNPITDAYFASDRTAFRHDGAAFNKLTKVAAIARNASVCALVRVCWQGPRLDRNCGLCFKCVATQVCFRLCGVDDPPAFPQRCSIEDVSRLPVKNEQNAWLVRAMRDEARRNRRHDLCRALDEALARAGFDPDERSRAGLRRRWWWR